MRARPFIWILLCLLCLAGAWFFWHQENGRAVLPHRQVLWPRSNAALPQRAIANSSSTNSATSAKTNQFAWRLSNTTKSLDQLTRDSHAILLENALIDTSSPLNLSIPKNLQSQGDPGAYIVQARGPIDNAFRAMLARSGAEIVSYIPNDAYLVRAPAGVANGLTGNPLTQAVIPYEPYYKISASMPVTVGQRTLSSAPMKTNRAAGPSLLALAVKQSPLPAGTCLTLGLFKNGAAATVAQIEKLGGRIVARDNSPFGPVVRVQPPQNWTALATLSGVQIVEPCRPRMHANDLSRATVGVAADTQTTTNYLGLNGKNVMVEVNDTGIDANHPDLTIARVFGDSALSLVDTNGHGTHVAGIIAGSGLESTTVTNAQGSIMPGTNGQFRGMAPLANLYSVAALDNNGIPDISDQYMQQAPALTNALISNNSWNYGDSSYDLAAASYDAAVRDALPEVTGSQPVLFVFSAGNAGNGDDTTDPGNGTPDSIESPATAKNVITVGAIQEFRDITNQVMTISADGTITNFGTPWQPETSTSYRIAAFSSRGNVGIGTEGTFGRFKPDVVAPGTFILSTRSEQWDVANYFYVNPTNFDVQDFSVLLQSGSLGEGQFPPVPANTVQVTIQLFPNALSPVPFPDLPIYFGLVGSSTYPYSTMNNQVSIPPDGSLTIADILNSETYYGFNYAVSNNTSEPINFDIILDTITTNNPGNYFLVLSNLNQSIGTFNPANSSPGPYYRYETGTSMAAADVSGVLALMQDYFTNALGATPSPALLKAMLINGAHPTALYDLQVQNTINYEGWGLINLPNSLPPGVTDQLNAACASFFVDQSSANALATGDSHTYAVTIGTNATGLRVTLAWTDPPGDPAAAIKLVNDLNLVVSNRDSSAVYYGNDIPSSSTFNSAQNPTNTPNYDSINNVENVYLPAGAGTNFYVTIQGYRVNVNAVTAQTNNALGIYAPNVVQDYALVISGSNSEVTNAFTVTDVGPGLGIVSNPTSDQQITYVVNPDAPYMNQLAGASTPLLGTNTILLTTNGTELNGIQLGGTNIITLGMTNQWHFYVMTNPGPAHFTNAAFITFIPDTLSIPRMGVFADPADATRPEADIDLYVSTDPTLMNLNPIAISNADKSVGRGGTEFVYYTNSAPGDVYYVGVYSEDQEAAQYGFIPIFTDIPFSQMNSNGTQVVNGLVLPVNIPDGSPAHPGVAYVFALAIYPMEIQQVVVTNAIAHQNFGDLIGTLKHGGQNGLSQTVVLNNHDSLYNSLGIYTNIYDDSGQGNIFGSQPSDGPGSLNSYVGQQAIGPWILTEVDDSLTQTGSVTGFQMLIEPHQDATKGIYGWVAPFSWEYGYVDVPSGMASLTVSATNLTQPPFLTPPLELYVKYGSIPTLTDTNEYGPTGLTNGTPPGNSITINSPAPGIYWYGLYNGSPQGQSNYVIASFGLVTPPAQVIYTSAGPAPILDDAVMTDSIYVTANQTISSVDVGLRVNHPRVSDLVFHLISPDGTRVLLVENRGGATANMGGTIAVTNIVPVSSSGGSGATTNVINLAMDTGTLSIYYNFYTLPDRMVIYDQSGAQIFDSGMIPGSGVFNVGYTNTSFLTIEMNPFGNSGGSGDLWDYTVSALQAQQTYLVLTENTNLTTTPIKFAPPPFVPAIPAMTNNVFSDGFEGVAAGDYVVGVSSNFDSWVVTANQVTVISNTALAYSGSTNLLALADGTISRVLPTVPGQTYTLSYAYRGPGAVSLWRGESNANDSISGNNPTAVSNITYTAGVVGQAMVFNGTNAYIQYPASGSLNVGTSSSGFTIDTWLYLVAQQFLESMFEWNTGSGSGDSPVGVQFAIGGSGDSTLNANLEDTTTGFHYLTSPLHEVTYRGFQHVALTYNKATGTAVIYRNGVVVANANLGTSFTPQTSFPLYLGWRAAGNFASPSANVLQGNLDEPTIYNRPLSGSEIKAIYNQGTNGAPKYDTNAPAGIAQGLAEAQVTLNGAPQSIFFGNNTNWQTATYSFIATTTNTPLQITGLEPGMLLDSFVMTQIPTNNYDLYYLPEESLDLLQGENAYGQWQLEIQDDRAGAGLTNTLVRWQLRFNFPTAGNPVGTITSGLPQTNTIPAGGLAWYQINVPINADFATNILLFSTGPKNIWFDTNNPPTTNVFLFSGTNGSFTLSTTGSAPTNLIPGSTYYVVEQNTNSFAITNAFEVDFHFVAGISGPFAFTQPAYAVTGTSAQLNGMATPNGLPATAWFQWGTSTAYGNQTPPVSVGTGSNVVYVANTISGLLPNVPYHFRLVVSNALAVVYGFDQILDEANVVVWGADYVGQANVPSGLSNVVAIAGAYDHSLALKNNGTAVAWGDNTFGQANVPAGLNNLLALAGGEYYSMALKNSGTVAAWGANILGQTNVPAGLNNVVTIAGGTYSSLALRSDGTVTTWGANFFGLTNVPAGFSNAVAIAGGSYHNLAIKNDGTIVAWGDDSAGQTNVPAGLTNVVAIAGGSYHSLALRYDGTVVAWGDNSAGQTSVPAGLSHVVAVAAGGFHSLALKNDGTVVAWGDNTAGQTSVPVGLSNVVAIASGYFHSLALTPLFNVNPTNPIVLNLTNGVPQTNSILAGGIVYYQVNVPANADFATNILLFTLNGPLNVWLGTNSPTTNVFLFSGTNGSYTLSTTGTPPLVPGSTYYLGVQNTNSFTVNYGIEVDFHLLTATNAPIFISGITATNIGGTNGFLLQWQGPTNFQYEIQWTTNLLPLIVWNTVLNPVINVVLTSTNGHYSFFDDGSLTGGPALMKFYRILASPNLGPITNPGPATNAVLAGATSQAVVTVPANAIAASNFLIAATGPLNVWFNQTNPPTGNTNAGDFLMLSATSAGAFVLTGSSVPPLVPGTNYYLGIQNPGASNVTFVFQVAFGFAPTNAMANFSITATNGGIWLRWNGLTNYQYQVQWKTNLAPPSAWNTISNIVLTSTTGIFTFFDDGSLTGGFGPMKFYRLIAWPFMTPIPQTLSISSVTVTNIAGTNDLLLRWSAPTNYQYGIQWTTNLTLPFSNWFIIASPVLTLTNGVYTFIDNGQTGPPAGAKFFRLLEN